MIADIIILVILVVAALTGYRKGVIAQLGSVVAVVVALLICHLGGDACSQAFCEQVCADDPSQSLWTRYTAGIIANVILFVVVWLAVRIIFVVLKTVIHSVMLGPIDGLAGAAFRVLWWGLLVSIVLNIWLIADPGSEVLTGQRAYGRWLIDSALGFGPWLWGQLSA